MTVVGQVAALSPADQMAVLGGQQLGPTPTPRPRLRLFDYLCFSLVQLDHRDDRLNSGGVTIYEIADIFDVSRDGNSMEAVDGGLSGTDYLILCHYQTLGTCSTDPQNAFFFVVVPDVINGDGDIDLSGTAVLSADLETHGDPVYGVYMEGRQFDVSGNDVLIPFSNNDTGETLPHHYVRSGTTFTLSEWGQDDLVGPFDDLTAFCLDRHNTSFWYKILDNETAVLRSPIAGGASTTFADDLRAYHGAITTDDDGNVYVTSTVSGDPLILDVYNSGGTITKSINVATNGYTFLVTGIHERIKVSDGYAFMANYYNGSRQFYQVPLFTRDDPYDVFALDRVRVFFPSVTDVCAVPTRRTEHWVSPNYAGEYASNVPIYQDFIQPGLLLSGDSGDQVADSRTFAVYSIAKIRGQGISVATNHQESFFAPPYYIDDTDEWNFAFVRFPDAFADYPDWSTFEVTKYISPEDRGARYEAVGDRLENVGFPLFYTHWSTVTDIGTQGYITPEFTGGADTPNFFTIVSTEDYEVSTRVSSTAPWQVIRLVIGGIAVATGSPGDTLTFTGTINLGTDIRVSVTDGLSGGSPPFTAASSFLNIRTTAQKIDLRSERRMIVGDGDYVFVDFGTDVGGNGAGVIGFSVGGDWSFTRIDFDGNPYVNISGLVAIAAHEHLCYAVDPSPGAGIYVLNAVTGVTTLAYENTTASAVYAVAVRASDGHVFASLRDDCAFNTIIEFTAGCASQVRRFGAPQIDGNITDFSVHGLSMNGNWLFSSGWIFNVVTGLAFNSPPSYDVLLDVEESANVPALGDAEEERGTAEVSGQTGQLAVIEPA